MRRSLASVFPVFLFAAPGLLAACDSREPTLQERLEEAAEEVEDEFDDTKEKLEDAKDEIEDEIDDAT